MAQTRSKQARKPELNVNINLNQKHFNVICKIFNLELHSVTIKKREIDRERERERKRERERVSKRK